MGTKRSISVVRIVAAVALAVLCVLLVNALWPRSIHDGGLNLNRCGSSLNQLRKMAEIYRIRFGGRQKELPPHTGASFWLALSRTSPPLIGERHFDVYLCPFDEREPAADLTTYRGPARPAKELGPDDVVGSCAPGLHPDGSISVVLMSGEVHLVYPDDDLYARALADTLAEER